MKANSSIKTITLVILPVVIICIQVTIKLLNGSSWYDNLGITLSAIGIGQIFPLIIEENLLVSKFIRVERKVHQPVDFDSLFTADYKIRKIGQLDKLEDLRLKCIVLFLICLVLFIITVFLNIGDYPKFLSIFFGAINCVLAWFYFLT